MDVIDPIARGPREHKVTCKILLPILALALTILACNLQSNATNSPLGERIRMAESWKEQR